MHKGFAIANAILLGIIGYLVFGQSGITGYAILDEKADRVIIGSSLYYKLTDVESGEIITNEPIANREIFMARKDDGIKNFSNLRLAEEWNITADADKEESKCSNRTYDNRKYYYDDNGNSVKDEEDFSAYSVISDGDGCFNIRLPDDEFVVILGKKN